MTDVLVARDLARTYGDTVALAGVSLSVGEGEVLGLVGPNGAGKTTLVRALTGTTDAEGAVELFGESSRTVNRSRIGLLPQSFDPPARLTARELIEYYAGLYDHTRDVAAVLSDVGLEDATGTAYEDLSGGQQRRVCVGTALVNDPDLLVLDEPTTGIDPAGRRAVWRLLEGLADTGTTIVLTTHYMAEVERLADRVGLLSDGELLALDAPQALIDEYGGQTRLVIDLDGEPQTTPSIGFETTRSDGRLVVHDVSPTEIGAVVDRLTDSGITPASLTWREPDMEDVYLELTGTAVGHGGDPLDPTELEAASPVAADGGER
ncbi:ABC transporter ATP-binding protein [Halapricum hydrolyticum]|uniref:ABC transporter ATP-binding protein n=1 Tax=Halapricum hydrolyticum TaxID=2979991 RepID=A0AAE3IBY2_9EURY|nr:ABC transporter ATP-binding protein [Halapricum hydrolyticum]MCU4718001.1 ABC transporter ATP-binding protein [Halapricum hydrolyticum]MCU4727166.1 ABC transporter ATP-binding protein [Halapricum hydrolyticum]